jgi:hypothetical protein
MATNCECGMEVSPEAPQLGCLECGTTCCRSCAINFESATYCRGCAGSLLGVATVRSVGTFDLQ